MTPYQLELLKMFSVKRFDLNESDSNGNTLLHIVIACWSGEYQNLIQHHAKNTLVPLCATAIENMVKLLLENGIYIHARNNHRKTAIDILDPKSKEDGAVMELIKRYDKFPTLKHMTAIKLSGDNIPYNHYQLPEHLVKFIKLH